MHRESILPLLFLVILAVAPSCAPHGQQVVQEKPVEAMREEPLQYRWISAKGGLTVRDVPNASGKKVGAIPFGTQVLLEAEEGEVIVFAGRKGRWARVSWYGEPGWVFGGFLSAVEILDEKGQPKEQTP